MYHCHDDTSNVNGFADSCTKFKEYIKLAKKNNMPAIAFSNHGGIYDWIKKKQECDKAGIKYIHGIETYVCNKLEDNDRGCHIGLYARNWNGVLELNTLISKSTSKGIKDDNTDRHMYYNPRISLDELMSTSDNIIVTTACLASPLNKWRNDDEQKRNALLRLIKWLSLNKHRCFLEIQYHNANSQKEFNKWLYEISIKYNIPIIAGTDTHSSSDYKAECRKILQISKDSFYGEEDEFDLTFKTYDELVEAFKNQKCLPLNVYMDAIANTITLADMVEDFTLDKSFKYPTLYGDNVRVQWKNLIYKNFKEKKENGVLYTAKRIVKIYEEYIASKQPSENNPTTQELYKFALEQPKQCDQWILKQYKIKIASEYKVMCKLGMESFMMFMSELLTWCTDDNIPYGTGRGSVCGSEIAYITNITDVDPIIWKTVFSRFCNEDRVSLGDIDVDFAPEDREKVYQYIIQRFTPQKTAYIAAFSTLKDRGCIDVLAKGLNYKDLDKVMDIKNQFEDLYSRYSKIIQEEVNLEEMVENAEIESSSIDFDNHSKYVLHINNTTSKTKAINIKKQYDELINDNTDLFYYLDGLKGTIIAKGHHPSGIIGSPITLQDHIGVFYQDGKESVPISTCAMKAVDSLNYVKFDILGLKTVGIIKDACKYAGITYPKSHTVNWYDKKIWNNMITTSQGVFQFEGDYAFSLLKDFKPNTINHMSMVNAALRPSGKSYRNRLIAGESNKNPSTEIDELLKDNNGFLIFQEDTIKFLTDICDFKGSEADTTRRAIGKKDEKLLKEQLPKILEGYCKHSSQPKEVAEEEAKQFIQIVQDSSEYQFGFNHSTAYSMNGYECVGLRTYYPLEFTTAYLNRAENSEDTNYGIDLAKLLNIEIKPIKFGKSLAQYTLDKQNNSIYKGIASIKFCNSKIANELIELSKDKNNTFVNLLDGINSKTSVNNRQLKILTGLNFFDDFGKNKYLLNIIDLYNGVKIKDSKTKKDKILLPSLRDCSVIKKAKIEGYHDFGLNEFLIKKYSKKETAKQYSQIDNIGLLNELISNLENKSMSVIEQVKFEMEYLEYVVYTNPNVSNKFYIVVDFKTYKDKTKPYLILRNIKTGDEIKTKIKKGRLFAEYPFKKFSVLKLNSKSFDTQFKSKMINGKWQKSDETEEILVDYQIIK